MQFDVLSGVLFEGGEEEGEVLFDINLGGRVSGLVPDEDDEDSGEYFVPPSFDEIIQDHYPQMVVNARYLTGDESRADDVVQESMVRALRSWDRFLTRAIAARDAADADPDDEPQDFDDAVSSWLHRIVTNAFINMYHHGKRATRRAIQWASTQRIVNETVEDPRVSLDSPIGDEVARALATLNGDQRKVVEMHFMQGMDCPEIAAELGLCRNTVFTRLHRAKVALGPLLEKYARSRYGIGLRTADVDEDDEDAA